MRSPTDVPSSVNSNRASSPKLQMSTVFLIVVSLLIISSYHEAASDEINDDLIIFETTISNASHVLSKTARLSLDSSLCTESTECAPARSCFTAQQETKLITYPPICGWDIGNQPFVCCPSENVSYPSYTNPCPEPRSYCVNVTSCRAAARRDIQIEKNHTFCGWATADDPLVCCPEEERPLRPQVCGLRHLPGQLDSVLCQEEINIPDNTNIESARIIGGEDSVSGAWPWMAGIYSTDYTDTYCGAIIISQYDLVTAAHCFNYSYESFSSSMHYIFVGSNNFLEGTQHFIRKITVHPDYIPEELHDDIAVIRLQEPIQFGTNTQPICLPTSSEMQGMELIGRNVTVLGWGYHDVNDTADRTILQEMTLQVTDPASCNETSDLHFCAAVPEGGKDTCLGDSGGPLMLFENGTWVLVGVVSYGDERCGVPKYPGIYTRVTTYIDWLQEVTA